MKGIMKSDKFARRVGGGLLGYAFAISLVVHLIIWGLVAWPRDDAGVRPAGGYSPSQLDFDPAGRGAGAPGALAFASTERGSSTPREVLAGARGAPGEESNGDGSIGRAAAALPPAPAAGAAPENKTGGGFLDAGGPPDNTRNVTALYNRPPALFLIPGPVPCIDAAKVAASYKPAAYVDESGRVRNAAVASSGATVALQDEARRAAVKRADKVGWEQDKEEAEKPARGILAI